ncbi:MAG: signal peptidase II [Clostridia bacterium]|nr:signal peptidase II [Clostridia bacterium]
MGFLILSALVLVGDQFSKHLVQLFLDEGESLAVVPDILHITLYKNPGAAFGILAHRTSFFILITAAVMILVLYLYISFPKNKTLGRMGLALQFGGAAGNLIDRLINNGYVVDFIDLRIWPIFNIADSAIVLGTAFLIWEIMRWQRGEPRKS